MNWSSYMVEEVMGSRECECLSRMHDALLRVRYMFSAGCSMCGYIYMWLCGFIFFSVYDCDDAAVLFSCEYYWNYLFYKGPTNTNCGLPYNLMTHIPFLNVLSHFSGNTLTLFVLVVVSPACGIVRGECLQSRNSPVAVLRWKVWLWNFFFHCEILMLCCVVL